MASPRQSLARLSRRVATGSRRWRAPSSRIVSRPRRRGACCSRQTTARAPCPCFHVDPTRGTLAAVLGSPFGVAADTPFSGISLAASSDGRFLYVSSSELVSFFVDANGGLNEIGSSWAFPQRVAGIAVTGDNSRLFLSSASGVTILHTGEGGLTADPPVTLSIGSSATDLRANASGSALWVSTQNGGIEAYTYQAGSASLVRGSPFFLGLSDLGGLAINNLNQSLVAYSPTALRLLGARINSDGSLALTANSPVTPPLAPTGAAFSPDGQRSAWCWRTRSGRSMCG